jgi:hypothetical protein
MVRDLKFKRFKTPRRSKRTRVKNSQSQRDMKIDIVVDLVRIGVTRSFTLEKSHFRGFGV